MVQIYTGKGKGKTTAAFGSALRAAGHGANVLIYQFLKPADIDSGERKAVSDIKNITVELLDVAWDMHKSLNDEKAAAEVQKAVRCALEQITEAAAGKQYDMIILDEIIFCLDKGLAESEDVKEIIRKKDKTVELILTGRGASDELIETADLVTEMKPLKHPFSKGTGARKGIEF